MNGQKREISIEIAVGLFMFIVIIALIAFTVVLSRDNVLRKSFHYEFVFTEIGGLREGDNVFLRGMDVGKVRQTALQDGRVTVYAALNVPLTMRKGYVVEVTSSSILGGRYLKIYEGPEDAALLGENVTIIGSQPIDVMADLGKAVNGLQGMIDEVSSGKGTLGKLIQDDSVYENMKAVSDDLLAISDRLEKGEGVLGRLLSSDDTLYVDVQEAVANLKKITTSLEAGEGTIGKLLKEDEVYEDFKATIANLRKVSEDVAAGKGTIGKLLAEDDQLYEDLKASMAAVRSISESISNGEGTLGRLTRDAALYDEATSLVEDMRAAIDDLRETSPVTTFSSVFFGAF
ncbi:MAG: MlaD family protein [Kiritimatiellales bacterium]|nr:MlaD family protein [Kiritimatiellales bacterium]